MIREIDYIKWLYLGYKSFIYGKGFIIIFKIGRFEVRRSEKSFYKFKVFVFRIVNVEEVEIIFKF